MQDPSFMQSPQCTNQRGPGVEQAGLDSTTSPTCQGPSEHGFPQLKSMEGRSGRLRDL